MSFTDSGTFVAWNPLRPVKTPLCLACGAAPVKPARCGGCKFAHFCGVECQKDGWPKHALACGKGYSGYISCVEAHTKRVAKLQQSGADNEDVVACYEEALTAAEAMGDSEGQRHLAQVLSFRLQTLEHDACAEAYARKAARIEGLIGKASASAKQIFDRVEGARLTPIGSHAAGGAKAASWCSWEQTAADLSVSVPLPTGTRKQALCIEFQPRRLRVALDGGVTIAEGELCDEIVASESSWYLSGGTLTLSLEKRRPGAWAAVLRSDAAHGAAASTPLEPPRPPDEHAARRVFDMAARAGGEAAELGPPPPPPPPVASPRDVINA